MNGSILEYVGHMNTEHPTAEAFEAALYSEFSAAEARGADKVVVNAGDLHRKVGGYPGAVDGSDRMSTCSNVMQAERRDSDIVITTPLKGRGAGLTIEYALPRTQAVSRQSTVGQSESEESQDAEEKRYWWVNHKQTYRHETGGGYIWSPKVMARNRRSQFYDNMRKVRPGDAIFSYASGKIRKVGIASRPAIEAPKPSNFGTAGRRWDEVGWMVPITWHDLQQPFSPASNLRELRPLLPQTHSPYSISREPSGTLRGQGNQVAYLASISRDLAYFIFEQAGALPASDIVPAALEAGDDGALCRLDDAITDDIQNNQLLPETERQALVQARRGQGRYRANLEEIEFACRVSGVTSKQHLIASHIKPWRACETSQERLDGHNGFLLSPNIDHLFDRGYISFSDDGEVMVAARSDHEQLTLLGLDAGAPVKGGPFTPEQKIYLRYHRDNVFLGS